MGSVDNQCSICWETYHTPKLLPCKHTFCKKCINAYHKDKEEYFNCPLCRTPLAIPDAGVSGFLDNYFTDDILPENVCDECWAEDEIKDCKECLKYLCIFCKNSHTCSPLSRERRPFFFDDFLSESFDSDWSSSTSSVSDFSRDYESISSVQNLAPFTFYKLKVESTVVENIVNDGCISSMFRISDNEVGAILFGLNIIKRYDIDGSLKDHVFLQRTSTEFDCCGGENILVVEENDGSIKMLRNRNVFVICETEVTRPLKIAAFTDGRVVVVGLNNSNKLITWVYDKEFNLANTFPLINNFHPQFLALNSKFDYVCLSFTEINRIEIYDLCGNFIGDYEGKLLNDATSESEFRPLGICCDNEGNVIVVDGESSNMHVLTSSGSLKGVMTLDDTDYFGHPYSIYIDINNKIWVGDSQTCMIWMCEIESYTNVFSISHFEQNIQVDSDNIGLALT